MSDKLNVMYHLSERSALVKSISFRVETRLIFSVYI
jgi:hypothetical protein